MARTERNWNDDFLSYMEFIAGHENYKGLPIERKRDGTLAWIVFGKGKIGQARKRWAEDLARDFGMTVQPGVYAQVMRKIHPLKKHICQICGSSMSIYYHYPSVNFLKALNREFGLEFTECDHIDDIWEQIKESGVDDERIRLFFKQNFKLPEIDSKKKDEVIEMCESKCRKNGKKLLSPGAMSNFPDRFDGFHTYNRCCRAEQDKGRSRENLKSYTKDRRAYEYWSDGNLHAANMFMGSQYFTGVSADHIGPISLGFVHDPRYLRPMSSSDNSTKRDRLLIEDIEEILAVEEKTGVYPMSWYSSAIWEFIKENYDKHPELVPSVYRDMLKQNMSNFMYMLKIIADHPGGTLFLFEELIDSKKTDFLFAYEFDKSGNITNTTDRNFTERNINEFIRFKRIAIEAVYDYADKENRNIKQDLKDDEHNRLMDLCKMIESAENSDEVYYEDCLGEFNDLVNCVQNRIIQRVRVAKAHK